MVAITAPPMRKNTQPMAETGSTSAPATTQPTASTDIPVIAIRNERRPSPQAATVYRATKRAR
jgi:hypothetical protein